MFCGPTQEPVLATANRKNSGEVLEKKKKKSKTKTTGEWTGRVEISSRKKSLAVSEACIHIHSDLLQALKAEPLRSGFSTDGSLIYALTVQHCGIKDREARHAL